MKKSFLNTGQLPLVIEPEGDASVENLRTWLRQHERDFMDDFYRHGAVLFRGFNAGSPKHFEEVALQIDPNLKDDYLGTSPRDRVENTTYIFSASELPGYYPIMQHCEMSYMQHPPIKLFFYCDVEPEYGGETPICDFRKVYAGLDKNIREEFDRKGLYTVRNYSGLNGGKKFNLWELKRWDQIFLTTDKKEVEKKCREYAMDYEWMPNDSLRISHRTPASHQHPLKKDVAWFNHIQVFHVAAAPIEYKYIHQRQRRMKTLLWSWFTALMVRMKKATTRPAEQSMNVLFADGTEIPDAYVQHIEDVIWKNIVIFPWRKNDILAIDNFSVSHGRMPYEGKRRILVCWSA